MLFLSISFILDDAQYTSKPLSVVVLMLVPNILSKKPNRKELAWGGVIGGRLATDPPRIDCGIYRSQTLAWERRFGCSGIQRQEPGSILWGGVTPERLTRVPMLEHGNHKMESDPGIDSKHSITQVMTPVTYWERDS